MTITLQISGQTIIAKAYQKIVADSRNYLDIQFEFSQEWEGLHKTAVFAHGSEVFNSIITNNTCLVPWEVIKPPYFTVAVFGGDLITTNKISIEVQQSGYIKGDAPPEPTPMLYDVLISHFSEKAAEATKQAENAAESAAEAADSVLKGVTAHSEDPQAHPSVLASLESKVSLGGQPNFVEDTETVALFKGFAPPVATLGVRWFATGNANTYSHLVGSDEPIAFPYDFKKGVAYEISFSVTNSDTRFPLRIHWGNSPIIEPFFPEYILPRVCDDTTVVAVSNGFPWLVVRPDLNWPGLFSLKTIRECTQENSQTLSIKDTPCITRNDSFFIGGGKYGAGSENASVGKNAMLLNRSGEKNVAFGFSALKHNSLGTNNTAVGNIALQLNTTGTYNTAVGAGTLSLNERGDENTAIGAYVLSGNTSGSLNTAVGAAAAQGNTTGQLNVAVGSFALNHNEKGMNNTAVGESAGTSLSSGGSQTSTNNSVFIGSSSKGSALNNQTNQIVIGCEAKGNGSNTITLGNDKITNIYAQVTAITALSDNRTKDYVASADLALCYNSVKALPVSRYKYKDFTGKHRDENVTGWLADDVERVFPKSVSMQDRYFPVLDENGQQVFETVTDEDGKEKQVEKTFLMERVKDITMTEAIPTLWGAVQALMAKVERLEEQITITKEN